MLANTDAVSESRINEGPEGLNKAMTQEESKFRNASRQIVGLTRIRPMSHFEGPRFNGLVQVHLTRG